MKILITGGTNGMGKGVAKALAGLENQEHEIIILGRSKILGDETVKELENTALNKNISFVLCDLTKLNDVRNAIITIKKNHDYLDSIFINAGLGYASKRVETIDGMDPHFQVNYLSHFMLTLNLLDLLEKSESGGRIIFNVTRGGEIFWDDIQMKNKWSYEDGIHQAMTAKRMFLIKLHNLYRRKEDSQISFVGFEISKTVWSNQISIIPLFMRIMATVMKFFGIFISIEKCGEIMAPLFTEPQAESLQKSGKLFTWQKNKFIELEDDSNVFNQELQDRLWDLSLELCDDDTTREIAEKLI